MRSCLGVLAVGCVACGGDGEPMEPRSDVRTFSSVQRITITGSEGSITLNGTDTAGTTTVTFTPSGPGDNFQFDDNFGELAIGAVCADGSLGCGTNIDVELPNSVNFDLTTESGTININGMRVDGTATTTIGDMNGRDLGQINLTTDALSGNANMHFRLRPLSVVMDGGQSGNLGVELPASGGGYNLITSTAGAVTTTGGLDGDEETGPLIELRSAQGDITVVGW
ncbi:MAG: hypothetical protein KTR31_30090 [Myxococcales bacterium]|nr:hypothetical protein [Myxococcales bacterium]